MGRFDEALVEMKRAQELDPMSPGVGTGVGRVLHFSERFDEALAQIRKALQLDPDYAEAHFALGMTLTAMKRYQEADRELTLAKRLSGDRPAVIALLGVNLAKWGKRTEAFAIARQLSELSRTANLSVYYSGLVYAALGDLDKALEYMEQAYKEREGLLVYANVEPGFKDLRSDPRFIALLKRMGLRK
jgi:Flp pilus assembly protein TadD